MSEPANRIDVDEHEIVIRLRRGDVDAARVSRFLDLLLLDSIRKRSQLSAADAADLADEIDRAVWDRARSRALE